MRKLSNLDLEKIRAVLLSKIKKTNYRARQVVDKHLKNRRDDLTRMGSFYDNTNMSPEAEAIVRAYLEPRRYTSMSAMRSPSECLGFCRR